MAYRDDLGAAIAGREAAEKELERMRNPTKDKGKSWMDWELSWEAGRDIIICCVACIILPILPFYISMDIYANHQILSLRDRIVVAQCKSACKSLPNSVAEPKREIEGRYVRHLLECECVVVEGSKGIDKSVERKTTYYKTTWVPF